jgi:sugar phosphate isomerase/epimerase
MQLSLAGWSLHPLFRSAVDPLQLLDFPRFTRDNFGIRAVELNNIFFASTEPSYLKQLVAAADSVGVKLLNIAVDEKGDLAGEDEAARALGLANYSRWVPVARELGCTAIRANSGGKTIVDRGRAIEHCIDSFRHLADAGRKHGIAILMENHGGLSVDADSILQVIEAVRESHGPDVVGTLPDFGNWPDTADRQGSLRKVLPYAKAVHAKVLDIDDDLNHPKFDLAECVQITREAGYDGYLGIEFEGAGDRLESIKRAVRKLTPLL